ncbi:uncharacterized protein [Penaeus vannamei]|uniref:uncharacterized protein n=1 Tax=Penaeus vannamei TaxID=6689 RepID=UPI00387F626B
MGPVPKERLKPSPPFYHAALDLFGPLLMKDTVKGRCKKKVYGVMINCFSSRASYVDLIEGYDADSFITTLRRFTALRGFPRSIYSDCGTQLKLASKELTQFGLNGGMEWNFTKSADAPWENGCSEALVKLVKKTIARVIGNATLTFGELQTVMFEIANILNERPIGMKNGSSAVQGSYLCPNDLILGRTSVKAPEGIFTHNKWHCEKRKLRAGDVVIVQDQNTRKGTWKLAEVCSIIPSSDGKVRDVEIRYKIQKENGDYEGQQDCRIEVLDFVLVQLVVSTMFCQARYVGSTSRWLCHCISEHKDVLRRVSVHESTNFCNEGIKVFYIIYGILGNGYSTSTTCITAVNMKV